MAVKEEVLRRHLARVHRVEVDDVALHLGSVDEYSGNAQLVELGVAGGIGALGKIQGPDENAVEPLCHEHILIDEIGLPTRPALYCPCVL